MVMVKPALAYLDVIAAVRAAVDVPRRGVPRVGRVRDGQGGRRATAGSTATPSRIEHLTAIKRAGADIILTYFARDAGRVAGVT